MLLHLSRRRSFWLCSHCRLEIPNPDTQDLLDKANKIKFNPVSLREAIAPRPTEKLATI